MSQAKGITVGTDRQPGGQERALGRQWQSRGPVERAKALGGGGRSFKRAGGGRGRRGRGQNLSWKAEINPEATAELQRVLKALG